MRLEYAESASGECPRRRDRQCGDVWLCSWLAACDPLLPLSFEESCPSTKSSPAYAVHRAGPVGCRVKLDLRGCRTSLVVHVAACNTTSSIPRTASAAVNTCEAAIDVRPNWTPTGAERTSNHLPTILLTEKLEKR